MYAFGQFIGFFAIMLGIMVIAFLTAKHKACWFFYGAGGVLQLLALLGRTKTQIQWGWLYSLSGSSYFAGTILRWVVYILLMIIAFSVIRNKQRAHEQEEYYRNNITVSKSKAPTTTVYQAEPKAPASAAANAPGWQCDCGRKNADYVMTCACGITKKEMKLRNCKEETKQPN